MILDIDPLLATHNMPDFLGVDKVEIRCVRVLEASQYGASLGDHTGEIMKLFQMQANTLFVVVLCLLAVPGVSAEPAHLLPAGVSSLSIFVTLGLLCLVVGLGLRAFSKPPGDLRINQPRK